MRGKEKTFSFFFFFFREDLLPSIFLSVDDRRSRNSLFLESWIYRIRDVKASLFPPPPPSLSSINSMHLFGDAELDQGLRPQAQVGARRLKIAGQDAFELFNLPSMERRRHLLRSLPSFPSRPSHP